MTTRLERRVRQAERELARHFRNSNTARQFGFELDAAERGRALLRMTVGPKHRQVHGVVHGGVMAALADTAAALAIYMALPRGTRLATVEMKINYLEAVDKGTLVADARMLRRGKNLAVAECDVRDGESRLVGKALLTFSIGARGKRKRQD